MENLRTTPWQLISIPCTYRFLMREVELKNISGLTVATWVQTRLRKVLLVGDKEVNIFRWAGQLA